jgi:hypothetical protein
MCSLGIGVSLLDERLGFLLSLSRQLLRLAFSFITDGLSPLLQFHNLSHTFLVQSHLLSFPLVQTRRLPAKPAR